MRPRLKWEMKKWQRRSGIRREQFEAMDMEVIGPKVVGFACLQGWSLIDPSGIENKKLGGWERGSQSRELANFDGAVFLIRSVGLLRITKGSWGSDSAWLLYDRPPAEGCAGSGRAPAFSSTP